MDPSALVFAAMRRLAPLSERETRAIAPLLRPYSVPEGGWLLRAGERAEHSYFVLEGLVRELYVSEDGTEHTRVFVPEGQVTGSLLDLLSGEPSVTHIQALEPTSGLYLRYRALEALSATEPGIERLLRRSAEALYLRKARREHAMLALSAAQRYQQWLGEHPELDARVSRRHLASYLGVTPEHLSRLARARRSGPRAAGRRGSS
jgi:CRP-like cAMP-binding protein